MSDKKSIKQESVEKLAGKLTKQGMDSEKARKIAIESANRINRERGK
jgi:hypothetical protein